VRVRRLLFLAPFLGAAPAAVSQECADTLRPGHVEQLARKYAPFVWFSPKEEYFPTVPFFPAFDHVKAGPTDSVGLRNPDRVARTRPRQLPARVVHPLTLRDPHREPAGADSIRASWDHLNTLYTARRRDPPLSTAVFFRVRCLDGKESGTVWTFLRNDPQAWRRSKLSRLYDQGLQSALFFSVEYYFYYVRDVGLQGHPGDVEKLSVLLPMNPPPKDRKSAPLDSLLLDSLRVIIGAGHGFTTPNNVLVEIGPSLRDTAKKVYAFPHILVELGGHSIAPDNAPPDGRFNLGWDVNWNSNEAVWGVRDVQGVSGTGFLGAYKDWMTMPRYAGNSSRLHPHFPPAQTPEDRKAHREDSVAVEVEVGKPTYEQRGPSPAARPDSITPAGDSIRPEADSTYLLLPVKPFEHLFRWLAKDTLTGDSVEVGDTTHRAVHDSIQSVMKNEIQPLLARPPWSFAGFDGLAPERVDGVIHLMRLWTKPLISDTLGEVPLHRTHIWEDFEYRNSPTFMLKRYLYRPTQNGLRKFPSDHVALLTANADFYLGRTGGKQFQIGILYPPGTKSIMDIPGVLELQVGLYGIKAADFGRNRVSLSILYDRHYRRFLSWYVRPVSWVRKRRAYERDSTASDVVLGFGGSMMPLLPLADKLSPPWRHFATTLRVRAGFRIDMMGFRPRPQRLETQISLYVR
jgi:hypothetical protein